MRKKGNRLHPDNCNRAMCKTCIFGTDGNQVELSAFRKEEIMTYLATMRSSHVCHTTNKTCYGALSFQATILYRMGIIPEHSVESFLETAGNILNGSIKKAK